MAGQRKRYDAALKAKVALEALKGQRTANEIGCAFGVHPKLVAQWKEKVLEQCVLAASVRKPNNPRDASPAERN